MSLYLSLLLSFCLFDVLAWSSHRLWHRFNLSFHFIHHQKNNAWHLHPIETAWYFVIGIAAAVIGGVWASVIIECLIGMAILILVTNWLGHAATIKRSSAWHTRHHKNPKVNFSFFRVLDVIAGTNNYPFSLPHTTRIVVVQFLYLSIVAGTVCLPVMILL
jgi:hypothetical protein